MILVSLLFWGLGALGKGVLKGWMGVLLLLVYASYVSYTVRV